MDARTILASAGALLLGGAAVATWTRWGPCLSGEQEVQLRAGQTTSVGCDGAELTFVRWSDGAELRASCPSLALARLSDGSADAELCGLWITLLDHSVDPRLGGDQVRLSVDALESE